MNSVPSVEMHHFRVFLEVQKCLNEYRAIRESSDIRGMTERPQMTQVSTPMDQSSI